MAQALCQDPRPVDENQRGPELLDRFLEDGFVILTLNSANDPSGTFEAWAYSGPLDFSTATPVRFGLGSSPLDAFQALQQQLADTPDNPTA